jgi:hypothetical protein
MRSIGYLAVRTAVLLWASPWTLLGLMLGVAGLLSGGSVRRGPGIVEFHGGAVGWLLRRLPAEPFAMTLGHTVLGLTAESLDLAQPHELVHVRQYERWGPLFYSSLSDLLARAATRWQRWLSR